MSHQIQAPQDFQALSSRPAQSGQRVPIEGHCGTTRHHAWHHHHRSILERLIHMVGGDVDRRRHRMPIVSKHHPGVDMTQQVGQEFGSHPRCRQQRSRRVAQVVRGHSALDARIYGQVGNETSRSAGISRPPPDNNSDQRAATNSPQNTIAQRRKPPSGLFVRQPPGQGFSFVAGAGLEPATFGL